MFSLRFTIILLLVLFIPLGLRKLHLEPYPAMLFPEGAHVMRVKRDTITTNYLEVYGMDKNSKWQKINLSALMQPIPDVYFTYIINHAYKDKPAKKNLVIKFLSKIGIAQKVNTATDRDKWFVNKLAQMNLNTSVLRLVSYKKTVNIKTGAGTTNIADEKLIRLVR